MSSKRYVTGGSANRQGFPRTTLDGLDDVSVPIPAVRDDLLAFNGEKWTNVPPTWLKPIIEVFDNTSALPAAPAVGDRYRALVTANGWIKDYIYEYTATSTGWTSRGNPASLYIVFIVEAGTSLYAGTADAGLFQSSDGGTTWTSTPDISTFDIRAMVVINATTYLVATPASIYRTTDSGATWTEICNNPPPLALCFIQNDMELYIGTYYQRVWRSIDGGFTWNPTTAIPFAGGCSALLPDGPGKLFAAIWGGGFPVYHTDDSGATWVPVSTGLPNHPAIPPRCLLQVGTDIYVGFAYAGIYKTSNSGVLWNSSQIGIPPSTSILSMTANASEFYAGGENSDIYYSTDGTNWSLVTTGLPAVDFVTSMLFTAGNVFYVAIRTQGIYNPPVFPWAPTLPLDGMIFYNKGDGGVYGYDGSDWQLLAAQWFYGTGAPPSAVGLPEGSLYFQYTP